MRYYRSSSESKNPREDIVAAFGIRECEMLCIRGYNPKYKPAIQFVHRAKQTQKGWAIQSELFASIWSRVASKPPKHPDGKISLRDSDAVERAQEALTLFAKIMSEHPTR